MIHAHAVLGRNTKNVVGEIRRIFKLPTPFGVLNLEKSIL